MAGKREVLRKVGGRGRLAAATFEIHDRQDLQRFAFFSLRHIVPFVRFLIGLKILAKLEHLLGRIVAPTTDRLDLWTFALGMYLPEVTLGHSHKLGYFRELKLSQAFSGVRRILLTAQHMQRTRYLRSLLGNLKIKSMGGRLAHFANYFLGSDTFEKMAA